MFVTFTLTYRFKGSLVPNTNKDSRKSGKRKWGHWGRGGELTDILHVCKRSNSAAFTYVTATALHAEIFFEFFFYTG